jgi:hypothetical protein
MSHDLLERGNSYEFGFCLLVSLRSCTVGQTSFGIRQVCGEYYTAQHIRAFVALEVLSGHDEGVF